MSFDLSKTLKDIRQAEATAERFYSSLLKELEDKKVVSNLTHIRNDERNHTKWVQGTIEYAQKKKVPTVTTKVKPAKGIILTPGATNLVITRVEKWFTGISSILKALGGKSIAYMALNRPISILKKNFEETGIDLAKIDFVEIGSENFVRGHAGAASQSLTAISIAVSRAKKPIVIFDNVSVLAIYNPPELAIKFLRSIAEKAAMENFAAIFLITENAVEKPLIDSIKAFADNVMQT